MRKINAEKELDKIKKGNKNKIIIGICTLLVIIAIGSTYALYQVRHTNNLVYNNVDSFSKITFNLPENTSISPNNAILSLGQSKVFTLTIPDGYELDTISCTNSNISDINDTTFKLGYKSAGASICSVTITEAAPPPNEPDLMQGLIPVTIAGDGTIKVADTNSDWYDYSNHEWANAVLVSSEKYADLTSNNQVKQDKVGTTLNLETDILQMYVWIPRFKYQLFNTAGTSKVTEQMINIEFESDTATTGDVTCKYTQSTGTINENCTKKDGTAAANGDWYTHPAFTFKGTLEESGTELTGIWVGKFESSGTNSSNQITNLKIVPNVSSLRSVAVAYMFQGVRDLEEKHSATYNINPDEIDTHMMKNMEWGAVAYLTQSKYGRFNSDGDAITDGAEVWINNDKNYTTGCSGNSVSAGSTTCTDNFKWNMGGIHASTTNNVSGVYDMSGGAYEYVMGNMVDSSGNFYSSYASFAGSSGVIVPNPAAKYYDMYTYGTSSSEITRGHLGDATKETRSWYSDYADFPDSSYPWSHRGGGCSSTTTAGVWYSSSYYGTAHNYYSFRVVLSRS